METLQADGYSSATAGTTTSERAQPWPSSHQGDHDQANGAETVVPGAEGSDGSLSRTYAVACSSAFRDAVTALARRRSVGIADIVRAVLYVIDPRIIEACPDPGGPMASDREEVVLLSGPSKNRVLKRKPRIQARLPDSLKAETIRKSLALALAIDKEAVGLKLVDPSAPTVTAPAPGPAPGLMTEMSQKLTRVEDENQRMRQVINDLSFPPLESGVRNRAEALFVLGFPPFAQPDSRQLKERYRLLARIHHPDGGFGDHGRMSQLNAAFAILQAS